MSNAETKICTRCGIEKSVNQFHVARLKPDGRQSYCNGCVAEYNKLQRKPNWISSAPCKQSSNLRLREYAVINGETDCWLWQKPLIKSGYGRLYVNGRNNLVHRVAYEEWIGPIPTGMTIDHLCGVRHCINPAHMELVSLEENGKRGSLASRRGTESVPEYVSIREGKQTKHCATRLTVADIPEIFLLRKGGMLITKIGEKFNVDRSVIGKVLRGKAWAGVVT
jgi:hypothetical protein